MSTIKFTTITSKERQASGPENPVTGKIHKWLGEGADWCSEIHDRVEENNSYLAGDTQWRRGDIERQEAKGRPTMVLNKVLQVVNAVANREITERYVPKVYGRDRGDSKVASALDEVLRWQRDRGDVEHYDSMAFRDLVGSGYGCVHTYYDELEDDGNGAVRVEVVPVWEMVWDSRAREQNLADRRWHMRGRWVSRIEIEEEFAEAISRNREIKRKLASLGADEDEFSYFQQAGSSSGGRWPWDTIAAGRWYNRADDEVFVIEAEWKDVVTDFRAAVPVRMWDWIDLHVNPEAMVEVEDAYAPPDPETGEPPPPEQVAWSDFQAMDDSDRARIRDLLLAETEMKSYSSLKELDNAVLNPWYDATGEDFTDWAKKRKYQYRYAIMIEDMVLEEGERKTGFTYEFLTGYPNISREGVKFFGVVDVAKGPQDWRNTFMSLALVRLATAPKQHLLIEESSVEDIDYFLDQYANPRGVSVVPDGFIAGNRFMVMEPPRFPDMERELIQMADQGVTETAGLSGVDLGGQQDLRRVSGTVVQSVKEASNTILAIFFDSLRRYRRRHAKLVLAFMREFYDMDTLRRAIGEEYGQMLDEAIEGRELSEGWPEIERFDIKLDEAQTSVTEKLEWWDKLTQTDMLSGWVNQNLIPFEVVLDWAPWMTDFDRARIREHLKEQEQSEDLQGQLEQLQSQYDSLKKQLANAGPETQRVLLRFEADQAAQGQGESQGGPPPESTGGGEQPPA